MQFFSFVNKLCGQSLRRDCHDTNRFVVRHDLTLCWNVLWVGDSSLPNNFLIKKTPNISHQERPPKLTARSRFQRDNHHLLPTNMAKTNLYHFANCVNSTTFTLYLFCSSSLSSLKCFKSDRRKKGPIYMKEWTWEEIPSMKLQLPTFLQLPSF